MHGARLITFVLLATGAAAREPLAELETRYNTSISHGLATIPIVAEFAGLYSGAAHSISYYTAENTAPVWNSKAGVHGRYVLTVQIPVAIDRTTNKVSAVGEPKFYLNEITSITSLPDGRSSISYDGVQIRFGADEWQQLLRQHGDLSVLGIRPKTRSPVEGFQTVWKDA